MSVRNLSIAYRQDERWLEVLREVSLTIASGETYGLVGESGSGKTTLAMAIMGYLPDNGRVTQGSIHFAGQDLLGKSRREMTQVWGRQIGLVPQNPLSSLNPTIQIGEQVAEVLRQHQGLAHGPAWKQAVQLLARVRISDPEQVARSYPHQLSGGMQQRVLIAMALSTNPRLLVLDEPTTSLDVTTQASILDLFRDHIQGLQTSMLYVTHNLGVVAQLCDRVGVLYAGELVEEAGIEDLFSQPRHPYTQALLDSVPRLGANKDQVQLKAIEGQIPPLGARPQGCVFVDRCPLRIEICQERPPLYPAGEGRFSRCHRWQELAEGNLTQHPAAVRDREKRNGVSKEIGDGEPKLLELNDLRVSYDLRRTAAEVLAKRPKRKLRAVDGISLELRRGKTLGLVGESGSGKSTLARSIVGLVERSGGEICLAGVSLPEGLSGRDAEILRQVQMVFQNPDEALNPYRTVGASLERPYHLLMKMPREEAEAKVRRLLELVSLPVEYAERYPGQLSGGEKQRVAIARAFAAHPDLLLADEPVSSLDVSVQASILNLLHELQVERGITLLLISHDLAVVGYLADEIAVIYLGRLMEVASAQALFKPPYHPYTEALLSAIPRMEPGQSEPIRLEGEIPDPGQAPGGCPFHTRCPRFLGEICVQKAPPWQTDPVSGKRYYCHIPPGELREKQS